MILPLNKLTLQILEQAMALGIQFLILKLIQSCLQMLKQTCFERSFFFRKGILMIKS